MKRFWLIVAVLFFALGNSKVGMAQWAGVELPAVTGSYGVGTIVVPMVDERRSVVYADGGYSEHRELMTQIWYPTDKGATGSTSTYLDKATAEYLLKDSKVPGLDQSFRFLIKGHGVIRAKVATGCDRFPVLIFSPGWQMSYFLYQSILEDLASHGYIVVGVNSPNSAGIMEFPDGHVRVTPDIKEDDYVESKEKVKYNQEVADDLIFVAKQLWILDRNVELPLAGRVDFGRIGYFGHSFGGAAAVQASIQNIGFSVAANFDGSLRGEDYKKKISKPMLMVWSDSHSLEDWTMKTIWGNLPSNSYQATVKGTNHMSFSDSILIMKSMGLPVPDDNPIPIDPGRGIQSSRDLVRSFFDVNFKHADSKVMNQVSQKYQEVHLDEKHCRK